jgi:hypothetical protein
MSCKNWFIILCLAGMLLSQTAAPAQNIPPGTSASPNLVGYTLTFDDEFNTLNANVSGTQGIKWETEPSSGVLSNGGQGTINPTPLGQPGSLFSVSNSAVDMLIMPDAAPYLDTDPYGVPGGFSQTYGYFEMRAKLTGTSGYSTAFWLLPVSGASWPPEIDIEESAGVWPNYLSFTNHVTASTSCSRDIWNAPNVNTDFHTYGLMWTTSTLTWYLDGQAVFSCPTTSQDHQPMYLIVSAYANHGLGYLPDAQPGTSDHMVVDYVRVWLKKC